MLQKGCVGSKINPQASDGLKSEAGTLAIIVSKGASLPVEGQNLTRGGVNVLKIKNSSQKNRSPEAPEE